MSSSRNNSIPYLPLWRAMQVTLLIMGIALILTLLFMPKLGVNIFWNIIIPITPAIIVIIPGIWRNICPMATISMLPRHLGISKRKRISERTHSYFALLGLIALLLIIPMRHLSLNTNGYMTALMLVGAAITAYLVGRRYEWKSAWCNGLCPIHPVEKLYGINAAITVDNAHCTNCEKCHNPCPCSTKSMTPLVTNKNKLENIIGLSMAGGFFGYIWGWYHVPDYITPIELPDIANAFLLPFGGFFISLGFFLILYTKVPKQKRALLIKIFAASAVSCYYWYRLPMLFGWGIFSGDGMLINLTGILPNWFPLASNIATTSFFFWFMVLRPASKKSWLNRPPYSKKALVR